MVCSKLVDTFLLFVASPAGNRENGRVGLPLGHRPVLTANRTMAWRTRRSQIDDSLTTLRDALKNDLRGSEAARTKLESPEHNDAGTLLDLIQLLPDNCKRTSKSSSTSPALR